MTPSYRDATVADAAALAELGARSFSDTFGHLYDPADLALFLANHTPAAWAAELGDPAFAVRVAEAEGAMIGYAKRGPPHLPFTPRGTPTELRQLYVLGPWQGAVELYLSVFTDNHRARRFYEKYGFVAEGSYAFMVGNHADEDIVMRLAL